MRQVRYRQRGKEHHADVELTRKVPQYIKSPTVSVKNGSIEWYPKAKKQKTLGLIDLIKIQLVLHARIFNLYPLFPPTSDCQTRIHAMPNEDKKMNTTSEDKKKSNTWKLGDPSIETYMKKIDMMIISCWRKNGQIRWLGIAS